MTVQLKKRFSHPSTHEMVFEAIYFLDQRKGSSVPAIKKFMTYKYEVDCVHLAPFIKKVIKSAVEDGQLKQLKMSYKISKKRAKKANPATSSKKISKTKK